MNQKTQTREDKRQNIKNCNEQYGNLSLGVFIGSDAAKYGGWFRAVRSVGFFVVVAYRLAHFLYERKMGWFSIPIQAIVVTFTFCNINRKANIGPGFVLEHPTCIFIGPYVSIGRDCRLGPRTFLGCNYHPEDPSGYPVIADGVSVAVGGVIMGGITIGEAVIIGPNVVVMKDILDKHSVLPWPARSILRTADGWD